MKRHLVSSRLMMAALVGLAVTAESALAQTEFLNTMNIYGVGSNPTAPATFTVNQPVVVNYIQTYHWNNGRGSQPGRVALRAANGQIIGPFNAFGTSGQGGAPNVNWVANSFAAALQPGTYQVLDSDPTTWSQNAQSGGRGFAIVRGTMSAVAPAPPAPPAPPAAPTCSPSTVNIRGFNYANYTTVAAPLKPTLLTTAVPAGGFITIQAGCMPIAGQIKVVLMPANGRGLPIQLVNARVQGNTVVAQVPPYPGFAGRSWNVELYNFSTSPWSTAFVGTVAVQ